MLDYSSFITMPISIIIIVTIFMNLAIPAWNDQCHPHPHVNSTCAGRSSQRGHFGGRAAAHAILPPSCEVTIGLSCMLRGLFLLISKVVWMSGRDLGHARKVGRKTIGKGSWKFNFKVIVLHLQNQINTIDYPISKESSLRPLKGCRVSWVPKAGLRGI